jgi:hypothetical protein
MNLKTNDNIGNEHQRCKGCEKTLPLNLFVINGKSYRTCNTCRIKNKESYQKKKQQIYAGITDQSPIEFIELYDLLSEIYERESENKENVVNPEFIFSCTINIATLEGDSKEKANVIIKELSDIDEYTWM